jgi:signal transduction histidine kinase
MSEITCIDQLVDVSLLKEHLDSITQTIGIPVYLINNDGTYLLGEQYRYRQICGRFFKNKLEKCKQCKLMDLEMTISAISNSKDGSIVYDCLPMMEVFGSPVIVAKKTIAVILAEKRISLELSISQLQECAQEAGLDNKTTNILVESISILPVIPIEKMKSAQRLIAVTANAISQLASTEFSLRHSIEQMGTVNEIVVALNRYKDIDLAIQFIVDQVVDLTKASDGTLFLWDESIRALVTYNKKDIGYCKVPERKGITNRALNKREAQRIDNVLNDPDYLEMFPNTQSELAIPLILESIPIGVLDVQSNQIGHFTEEHEQILLMLSKHVTAAILNTFITQVASSFENTRIMEELQKSAASKDELIRNLAHELKTPLTHIITFLEHLVNRSTSISDKEREFAKIAYQEMWRYVRLVDKILTFSRILGKRLILAKEPLILYDILKSSIDLCTPIAKDNGIELQFQADVKDAQIIADKDSLIQIFVNLLDNAIKYTPNGGFVHVSLEEQDNSYRIKVTDNGIGISKTAQQHLFKTYRSGDDARPGQKGGLGIGLYIVKQLVEGHQGSITVESKFNEGTTFTFDLPKKEAGQ